MVARFATIFLDVLGIGLATVLALILREDLRVPWHRFLETLPYLAATVIVAVSVFIIAGVRHPLSRFNSKGEGARLALLIALTVAGALGVTFAYNRLDGVVRSLPVLQFLIATVLLTSHRIIRQTWQPSRAQKKRVSAKQLLNRQDSAGTLVIGQTRLAQAYILALQECEPSVEKVAGVLRTHSCPGDFATWRSPIFGPLSEPVLGSTQDINHIVAELEVHGIHIARAVIARRMSDLSRREREELLKAHSEHGVQLDFLTARLGLEKADGFFRRDVENKATDGSGRQRSGAGVAISASDRHQLFWRLKRISDVCLALVLLLLLSPVMVCTALLVWLDVGCPLCFWQQRPGRFGAPFRLYKFRTMGGPRDHNGSRIPDHERSSSIGRVLRRFRLDELPQLFNILTGQMSFVGPRPLLPADQPNQMIDRLSVRPGLTGWAQVHCVRDCDFADKLALDLWYIQNASFTLDLLILLKTIPVVVFGERNNIEIMMRCLRDVNVSRGRKPGS